MLLYLELLLKPAASTEDMPRQLMYVVSLHQVKAGGTLQQQLPSASPAWHNIWVQMLNRQHILATLWLHLHSLWNAKQRQFCPAQQWEAYFGITRNNRG